ncbi:MAG TPA: hypothetical protein ENK91_12660 [Bacteroidetes bacterium]|nr:hypothetical protein [Bacteroidota bacterium]
MKKILFLFLIVGITIISCSKNKDLTLDSSETDLPNSVHFRDSEGISIPECKDGVLWFSDDSHVDAYYSYLDSVEETWSEDGFFKKNDEQFDFTSCK